MELETESETYLEPSFCFDPSTLISLPAFYIGSSSLESIRSSEQIIGVVKELVKLVKAKMIAVNSKVKKLSFKLRLAVLRLEAVLKTP